MALAAILPAGGAAAGQDTQTLAGRHVLAWMPARPGPGAAPVVVFSHGFGGCAQQSRFLTAGLAARGYAVFAIDHRDADCRPGPRPPREAPFREPGKWTDASYRDRAEDVRAVLAALRESPAYRGRLDLERIGLVGHSLGGYTVLGLGGAWPAWKLPGVRAVVALSPYSQPFLAKGTLGGLDVPVMYQGGTLDFGITPGVERVGGAFEASPAPKYFVKFQGIGHFGWTNLNSRAHDAMLAYTVAFLDHYLRGRPANPALTRQRSGVAELRWDSELGRSR